MSAIKCSHPSCNNKVNDPSGKCHHHKRSSQQSVSAMSPVPPASASKDSHSRFISGLRDLNDTELNQLAYEFTEELGEDEDGGDMQAIRSEMKNRKDGAEFQRLGSRDSGPTSSVDREVTPKAWDGLSEDALEMVHVLDGPEDPNSGEYNMSPAKVREFNKEAIASGKQHDDYSRYMDIAERELNQIEKQRGGGLVPGSVDRQVSSDWVAANLGWMTNGNNEPLDPDTDRDMEDALVAWTRGRWEGI